MLEVTELQECKVVLSLALKFEIHNRVESVTCPVCREATSNLYGSHGSSIVLSQKLIKSFYHQGNSSNVSNLLQLPIPSDTTKLCSHHVHTPLAQEMPNQPPESTYS